MIKRPHFYFKMNLMVFIPLTLIVSSCLLSNKFEAEYKLIQGNWKIEEIQKMPSGRKELQSDTNLVSAFGPTIWNNCMGESINFLHNNEISGTFLPADLLTNLSISYEIQNSENDFIWVNISISAEEKELKADFKTLMYPAEVENEMIWYITEDVVLSLTRVL